MFLWGEDDPVCMWLPGIRGYIVHISLQHLLFTLINGTCLTRVQ